MIRGNAAMTFARLIARARRPVRQLLRDKRGISAVEFAMLLPLMVTLYLGGVEVSQAGWGRRKASPGPRPPRGFAGAPQQNSTSQARRSPPPPPRLEGPHSQSRRK